MKSLLLIAVLCSSLSLYGQSIPSQQALIEASYTIKLNERTDKPVPPGAEGIINMQDKVDVILLCNAANAYSSIPYAFDIKDYIESMARILMGAHQSFYTDMATPSHIMEVSKDDDRVFVELGTPTRWTITDTIAEIHGIRCVFARGVIPADIEGFNDEKVTAWFAPEYPLPFGPGGLFGLPGLIVQAERLGITYTIKRIRNVSNEQVKIPAPGKGKYLKYAEYFKR